MFLLRRLDSQQFIFYRDGEACFTKDKSKAARFASQEYARIARRDIRVEVNEHLLIEDEFE